MEFSNLIEFTYKALDRKLNIQTLDLMNRLHEQTIQETRLSLEIT